jgi:predicted AlkP superfamily pyrophosphatase or phosphodiesterase
VVSAVCICLFALNLSATPLVKHVFIVSIDGGKPAVMALSEMPVLNQLVREGAASWTAATILPSVTLPSHTSMLTGVRPDKHHILWNDWRPRKGVVQVPTVFAEAKNGGFSTAMFVGKEKFRHLAQPGTLDYFEYGIPGPKANEGPCASSACLAATPKPGTVLAATVGREAAQYILTNRPNLCFIHLADPDRAGHKYGWGSPEQIKAFAEVDAALGVVVNAIRQAGIADDSVLIITADHGGHRKTHGNKWAEDVDIPWIAWGHGVRKHSAILVPISTCDTTATALWLLDLPLPITLDGRPITSAFQASPHLTAGRR